jgi:crotonobetainyl-CoA:carnitine CoA-transferase CaiB-like acyl-CoA transferase
MKGTHDALAGIRIIDLSMGWAGPLAARQLADMGADVIKVESCERFDWWRSWEATQAWIDDDGAEKSTAFNTVNRNKRNVTLDLEDDEGRDLLLRLVAGANAVVENFSGSVLPKLRLGYDVFKAVNPAIILLSMPAFGSTGPWAGFRAYGSTVEQSSGLPHLTGRTGDPPTMQHVALGDAVGGLNGSAALLTALRHQSRTGEGQYVDLSQVEGLFPMAAHGILEYAATGSAPVRLGSRHREYAPHGVYPCAGDDDWIVIQVRDDAEWQALKRVSGDALAGFGDVADRHARQDDLDARLGAWTADQDANELMFRLQQARVPAAATHRNGDLLEDPHLAARGFWQWRDRAVVGSQPNPSPAYRIGAKPFPVVAPAPTLGQHNDEVLGDLLGVSKDDLARLRRTGIIGEKPRMRGITPS